MASIAMATVFAVSAAQAADAAGAPAPARQQELVHLLLNDCGACHGLSLKGGLGLPLTADALRDKDDDGLARTILDGRPGTPMPPWRRFLSEDEARWLVAGLKRGDFSGSAP